MSGQMEHLRATQARKARNAVGSGTNVVKMGSLALMTVSPDHVPGHSGCSGANRQKSSLSTLRK